MQTISVKFQLYSTERNVSYRRDARLQATPLASGNQSLKRSPRSNPLVFVDQLRRRSATANSSCGEFRRFKSARDKLVAMNSVLTLCKRSKSFKLLRQMHRKFAMQSWLLVISRHLYF
jgi:hypothetical protein